MSLAADLKLGVERALDSPWVQRLLAPSYPPFAVEITASRIVGVAVDGSRRGLLAQATEELPAGVFRPSLLRPAVLDVDVFRAALKRVVSRLPGFDGALSVVLPDQLAKTSFVDIEAGGMTHSQVVEVLRWKLKRSTPFRIEDAWLAHQVLQTEGKRSRCLVTMVQVAILEQLESIAESLGIDMGLIELSSFSLWNLVEPTLASGEDLLLLNAGEAYATAIIGRRGEPLLVRCKAPAGGEVDAWSEIRQELRPTLLYYQDRIGGPGLAGVIVRAPDEIFDELRQILQRESDVPVERVTASTVGMDVPESDFGRLTPALGAALGRQRV